MIKYHGTKPKDPRVYFRFKLKSKRFWAKIYLQYKFRVITIALFAYELVHSLSEYSDENMMDPYNLAICFGPTLVPVPEDKDQVQYQNLVNELIKNIINAEDIFPNDGGTVYERYITREPDEG